MSEQTVDQAPPEHVDVELPDEPIHRITDLGTGFGMPHRETVSITEPFAKHFLEITKFPGDRPLDKKHVVFLARQMEGETFRWEQVLLAIGVLDGVEYRINGKHTNEARLIAKLAKGQRCPAMLYRYKVSTMEDLRRLYATFDRNKPRSQRQVVHSYMAGREEEFPGIPVATLSKLAAGLALWLWGEAPRRSLHTGDERALLLLKDFYKPTLAVANFLQEGPAATKKHLQRAPVYASMLGTFAKAAKPAHEFWSVVRDGVGTHDAPLAGRDDPRKVLRDALLSVTIDSGAGHGRKVVSSEDLYRVCVDCWNAARSESQVRRLRYNSDGPRPQIK